VSVFYGFFFFLSSTEIQTVPAEETKLAEACRITNKRIFALLVLNLVFENGCVEDDV
jgi:hypothetical protein